MPKDFSRTDRVADLIQRELSQIIQQEVRDPRLKQVTITAVRVASDLSFAKIYITQLDDQQPIEQTLKGLNKLASFLRYHLAQVIELRIMPTLRFVYDASISQGNHLAKLIDNAIADDERKHEK